VKTTRRISPGRWKLGERLFAPVFAFAVVIGLGCLPSATPPAPSATAADEPTAPKALRPPQATADEPVLPKTKTHASATEWYSPREADFRPEYDRDAANQARESWGEYWSWVQTFYQGNFLSPGWTSQGTATLRGVRSEKTRDELRSDLNELGRRVAAEWSKDNGVRKIDTAALRALGGRITKASQRDDGSGQAIQEELKAIRGEVDAKLAGH
jgi:hypothetical protein